jgi:hypothetical protein
MQGLTILAVLFRSDNRNIFRKVCVEYLRVLENRVLRRIFGPNRDEVRGGWRKLRNEELHNLYSSPSTIRITLTVCGLLPVKVTISHQNIDIKARYN